VQDQHETLELPGQVESVPAGRHFLQYTLAQWGLAGLGDDVALAASELIANAVLHARSSFRLELVCNEQLVVSVRDNTPGALPPAPSADVLLAGSDAEGGRGLALVAALSSAWGVRQTPPGKTVWFSMPLP